MHRYASTGADHTTRAEQGILAPQVASRVIKWFSVYEGLLKRGNKVRGRRWMGGGIMVSGSHNEA